MAIGDVLRVRYELTQLLHEGPIFTAYAARDRVQGREVCVRIIRPPFSLEPDFIHKIKEIVQQFLTIQHPGVEAMLEVDEDEGTPFLISELTKGATLAERIRKLAPFSVPVAVSTAISLCEALSAIHSAGLAHGDVSAVNVACLPDGQVELQIPGMWRAYASNPMAAGIALPSMSPYLSPEISAGGLPSPTSDVYAIGAILYELLTGRLPYNADTPVSMALKHATGTVPSVRMYNPSVPAVLDEIVKRALAKEPGLRYSTAGALLGDLRVLQDALRFGRTITWPIHPDLEPPQVSPMPKTTAPRPEAPRPQPKPKREREPSDVPLFLVLPIVGLAAVVATFIGVFVYFNLSKPPLAKVPSLTGLTLSEARDLLKPAKLGVEIGGQKSSETVAADHIISSDPTSGEQVREGSRVRLLMSTGSRMVRVPDLTGNSRDQAISMLDGVHLTLDDDVETQPSKLDVGLVVSQRPRPGAKVDQTTKVHIVLSSGGGGPPDAPNPIEPAPTGENVRLYTLRVKLTRIVKPVTLRVDIVDDLGTRTVYEGEHQPEETVELATRGTGGEVTFNIYYDNDLVKTVNQKASDAQPVDSDGDESR